MKGLMVPKFTPSEMAQKLALQDDYRDAFHPYGPVLINELAEPVRKECCFPGREPFRQSAKTAVKPIFYWRVRIGQKSLIAEHMVIPPGAETLSLTTTSGDARKSHISTIRHFWKSLGKVLFTGQVAAESWRLLLAGKWRLPTEFANNWLETHSTASYQGRMCALCRDKEENTHHLHYECTFVRAMWTHIANDRPLPASPAEQFEEFRQCKTSADRKCWHTVRARFFHAIRRIYVFYRFHHAELPLRQLNTAVRFVCDWGDGYRENDFNPSEASFVAGVT